MAYIQDLLKRIYEKNILENIKKCIYNKKSKREIYFSFKNEIIFNHIIK